MNRSAPLFLDRIRFLPSLILAVAGFASPALGQTPAMSGCTTTGMNWSGDPVFRAALHPSERDRIIRTIACKVEETRELRSDDLTVRLTLGALHHERIDGPRLNVKMVDVALVEEGVARSVGRVFLGSDPLDGTIAFAPQMRNLGGSLAIRLSPRHRNLFWLDGGKLSASLAFGWRETLDEVFPEQARSGENLGIDLEKMEGRIALRPIAKGPPSSAESAYTKTPVLVAKLVLRDGGLRAESTEIVRRQPSEEPFLDQINAMDETIRAGLKNLPDGTEPCSFGGWSNDVDPAGLNVRAAPNPRAKVLGVVPPPRRMPREHEADGPGPMKSEFRVIGHRDGWFLIENILPPGVAYDVPYPRRLTQPFKGRGWVRGPMVGGALANGGLPQGRLYESPHAEVRSTDVIDGDGNPIGPDTPIRRIHACSGWWALVETNDGRRGWWRSICSNQVTNCS